MNVGFGKRNTIILNLLRTWLYVIFATAIASKMIIDPETIEDSFRLELEELDKKFLNDLKSTKDRTFKKNEVSLEKEYKIKLGEIIQKYEKSFNIFFGEQKKTFGDFYKIERLNPKEEDREKDETALDMEKPFHASSFNLKLSDKEKKQIFSEVKTFKRKIKLRKFFYSVVPGFVFTLYFKLKLLFKKLKLEVSSIWFRIEVGTNSDFNESLEIFKEFFSKTSSKIKNFFLSSFAFVKNKIFKKKESQKEPATEDQKLVSKILNKK